jgi:Skp family chaperone for outer membrane proteins
MPSIRHTIVSAALAAGLVLAAGSAMLSSTAPATAPASLAPVESKVATVDTLLLLQALWERPEMDTARRTLGEELTASLSSKQAEVQASEAQLQQTLQTLQSRFNSLPEGDPERDNIVASYQTMQTTHGALQEQLQQLQADAEQRFDDQRAGQLREAYDTLKAAIATVAQREGYTHVISHATTQEQMEQFGFEGVLQAIRDRPVVFAPEGTDLTETLFTELGVSRPTFQTTPPGSPTDPAGPIPTGIDPTPVTPPGTDPATPPTGDPTTPPATPPGN